MPCKQAINFFRKIHNYIIIVCRMAEIKLLKTNTIITIYYYMEEKIYSAI